MNLQIDELRDLLLRLNIARRGHVQPCTEEEVESLERKLGVHFPRAYRNFLQTMGRGAGLLFQGTNIFYESLHELPEWSRELLEENVFPERLPADAIVFLMHQGAQFMFLRASQGDDPPVWAYNEAEESMAFRVVSPSFTEFLRQAIEGHGRLLGEEADIVDE